MSASKEDVFEMASAVALQRLRKELMALRRKPMEGIQAEPLEANILEWHYVLTGFKGSPYEGGIYHGTITFPKEYPFKPPSIMMFTPNGRFEVNTRLCLSMSDFHPESWNPLWSVGTILMGLYSFMQEEIGTHGSIVTTSATKRNYAKSSLDFNHKNARFVELFPDLEELWKERDTAAKAKAAKEIANGNVPGEASGGLLTTDGGKSSALPGEYEVEEVVLTAAVFICLLLLTRYIFQKMNIF